MIYLINFLEILTVFFANPVISSLLGFCGFALIVAAVKNIITI